VGEQVRTGAGKRGAGTGRAGDGCRHVAAL
jgi:hypothetical protein